MWFWEATSPSWGASIFTLWCLLFLLQAEREQAIVLRGGQMVAKGLLLGFHHLCSLRLQAAAPTSHSQLTCLNSVPSNATFLCKKYYHFPYFGQNIY